MSSFETPIFNLDTGYQFEETLQLRERVKDRYGIDVELKRPELSVEEYERVNGGPVYKPTQIVVLIVNSVSSMKQLGGSMLGLQAIRRDQSDDRQSSHYWMGSQVSIGQSESPQIDKERSLVFDHFRKIPYNPLHDQGYPSVGCRPCTRAVLPGEDERARWSGFKKTECGLHN